MTTTTDHAKFPYGVVALAIALLDAVLLLTMPDQMVFVMLLLFVPAAIFQYTFLPSMALWLGHLGRRRMNESTGSIWDKRVVFASLALGYIEIAIVLLVLVGEYCYYFVVHAGEPLNLP